MSKAASTVPLTDLDQTIEQAQATCLGRVAPGYRTRRVRWSGGTTQLIEIGTGEPLLLIHGGGGYAAQWGPILSALAERHRVLAVDRPGHGLADPFNYKGVDVLSHCHRFITEVLDAERLSSVSIAGNSMGGLCALAFSLGSPERVRHLLLVGFPAGMTRKLPLPMRLIAMPVFKTIFLELVMKHPNRSSALRPWKRFLVAHPDRLPEDFVDLEVACHIRNASTWASLMDRLFDSGGFKKQLVMTDRWKTLAVPTTFIWGELEKAGPPEDAEAVAALNPRIRVTRIPDAGHVPWFDNPLPVVDAINACLSVRSG